MEQEGAYISALAETYTIMLLRNFIFCFIITAFISCTSDSQKADIPQSNLHGSAPSSDIDIIDRDFNVFIEQFSKDTVFQLNRTKFPLCIKQYEIESDKDTIIYMQKSAFEMMDFRKKKSDSSYDQWKQEIVLDKSENKATIEIRGIDNGIVVDYNFEIINGKWMLVGVEDSST